MLLNICFIFALYLQFAILSSQQHVDDANTLIARMANQFEEKDYVSCINTWSDLRHHYPTGDQLTGEEDWIAKMGEFINDYVIDMIGRERQAMLEAWMEEIPSVYLVMVQSEHFVARFANRMIFEIFFRRRIRSLMGRKLDASPFIKSFVNGSGFCSIYKHPLDRTNELNLSNKRELNMAKLGSLIANLQERKKYERWATDLVYSEFFNAFRKISIVCRGFMKYPLDENRRKRFFSALLDDIHENQTLLAPLGPYVVGKDREICFKLVSIMLSPEERFFHNVNTTGFFLDECLEDLPRIFRFKLAESSMNIYHGSLFDRWMNRIENYMQRKLNVKPDEYKKFYDALVVAMVDSFPFSQQRLKVYGQRSQIRNAFNAENSQFDNYIRAVVEEIPTREAQLAYEKGEGLCLILSNAILYFDTLVKILVEYGGSHSYSLGGGLVEDNRNVVDVVRFLLLQITCQSLRNKSMQDIKLNLTDAKRRKIG